MLTFDETTIFYYNISVNKDCQKQSGLIKNWVDTVTKAGAATTSCATSFTLRPSTVTSTGSKPKLQPIKREGAVLNILDGGLSNQDETEGAEREAAVKSPLKNGKQATSSVSS